MKYCPNCGSELGLGSEKFCPSCGHDLAQQGGVDTSNKSIGISGTQGDVIGVGVTGNSNIMGKNIVVGSGTISVNEQQLAKLPEEYTQSLKAFSESLNEQLKGQQVPKDKVEDVQKKVDEFSKELEGVKPGQEPDLVKKSNLKSKLMNIARAALTILPKTLPAVLSTFTPLGAFSGLIGEDIQTLVQAIQSQMS